MKFRKLLFIVGLSAAWSTIALSAGPLQGSSVPPRLSHDFDIPIAGNPRTLDVKYERWKAAIDENESDLIVGLMWSKGLSNGERVGLVGRARIDIYRGTVSVELSGTEAGDSYDVWLVDNGRGPGASVVVTADDRLVRLGRLRDSGGSAVLEAKMPPAGAAGFTLDQVVVAEAGRSPAEGGGILFGSPTLFQRRFMAELQESSIRLAVRINPVAPSSGGTTCESPLEEQGRARRAPLLRGDLQRQRPRLRLVPSGDQQLHARSDLHRDPAAGRSALRRGGSRVATPLSQRVRQAIRNPAASCDRTD